MWELFIFASIFIKKISEFVFGFARKYFWILTTNSFQFPWSSFDPNKYSVLTSLQTAKLTDAILNRKVKGPRSNAYQFPSSLLRLYRLEPLGLPLPRCPARFHSLHRLRFPSYGVDPLPFLPSFHLRFRNFRGAIAVKRNGTDIEFNSTFPDPYT